MMQNFEIEKIVKPYERKDQLLKGGLNFEIIDIKIICVIIIFFLNRQKTHKLMRITNYNDYFENKYVLVMRKREERLFCFKHFIQDKLII